jgi:hypothetical protein
MDPHPGCVLFVAPRFYLSVDWGDRLLLGGVQEEAGRLLPAPPWRRPTPEEQAPLVADPAGWSAADALAGGVCLFGLPQHLRTRFWALLGQGGPPLPGFDPFVQEVGRFLAFKGLPAPPGAVFDLVLCPPGQRSVGYAAGGARPAGLADSAPGWWGGVNLGEEAVSLLVVNRPGEDLPARPGGCTLVRIRIDPGEGFRLPPCGVRADVATLDGQEPGVLLMVRQPG